MAWERVSETYKARSGELIRYGVQVKAPYSEWLASAIKKAIEVGNSLRNLDGVTTLREKTEIRRIYHVLPLVSARTGRSEPWWIYVEAVTRAPKGGPAQEASAVGVIYGLIALIIVGATAVLVSGKSFERFSESVGGAVGGTLDKVFNPGVVLAVFVLGFLFLTRRTA